jgi:hypothetical protein
VFPVRYELGCFIPEYDILDSHRREATVLSGDRQNLPAEKNCKMSVAQNNTSAYISFFFLHAVDTGSGALQAKYLERIKAPFLRFKADGM